MAVRLKPLARQTIVITGASSGIGLATARLAAERGAAVLLVARDEASLAKAAAEIRERGGRASHAVADVADLAALEAVAEQAEREFGGFDSWVNDAGISAYASVAEMSPEDHRRLFDTNYFGVVNGCLIAARRLRGRGGAIINVGSVLSDRAMIYQGAYSASKHAVKGFTDALRMELEAEGEPISVTLIKPAGMDTPFQEHARISIDTPGVKVPFPAYDPRLVARAICHACEHPKRDIVIGSGGAAISLMGGLFPRATDIFMERFGKQMQSTEQAGRPERRDNLYEGRPGGVEKSSLSGMPHRSTSLLLEAQLHPVATAAVVVGLGALVLGAVTARQLGHGRMTSRLPSLSRPSLAGLSFAGLTLPGRGRSRSSWGSRAQEMAERIGFHRRSPLDRLLARATGYDTRDARDAARSGWDSARSGALSLAERTGYYRRRGPLDRLLARATGYDTRDARDAARSGWDSARSGALSLAERAGYHRRRGPLERLLARATGYDTRHARDVTRDAWHEVQEGVRDLSRRLERLSR